MQTFKTIIDYLTKDAEYKFHKMIDKYLTKMVQRGNSPKDIIVSHCAEDDLCWVEVRAVKDYISFKIYYNYTKDGINISVEEDNGKV